MAGSDLRGRPRGKIETRSQVEFRNDDGSYFLAPGASILWRGTAEDALARLADVQDKAGWPGFYDAFDGKQLMVSEPQYGRKS